MTLAKTRPAVMVSEAGTMRHSHPIGHMTRADLIGFSKNFGAAVDWSLLSVPDNCPWLRLSG
jgi:hypothetical protein